MFNFINFLFYEDPFIKQRDAAIKAAMQQRDMQVEQARRDYEAMRAAHEAKNGDVIDVECRVIDDMPALTNEQRGNE